MLLIGISLFLVANQYNSIASRFQAEIQEKTDDAVPVVFLCPQTGYYSFVGEDAVWAAKYAVSQINLRGGINGTSVRLIFKDTRSDQSLAASYFLGASRKVPAVIGPIDAPASAGIAPLLEDTGTTSIASYSYEDIRTEYRPYTIAFMNDSEIGEFAAVRLWKEKNPDIKDVVIFTDSEDDAKSDAVSLFQKELPGIGLNILDVVDISGTRSLKHYEQCAIQALNKKAEGYISLLSAEDYANVLVQLRKRGVEDGRFITASFSAVSENLLDAAENSLDGTYIWDKFDVNYPGYDWQKLVKAYQASHNGNMPLNNTVPEIYDAVMALCQCYEELGLTGTETDPVSKAKVCGWFNNSPVIHGIQGAFRWENGEKEADYHFFVFQGSEMQALQNVSSE